MDRTEIDKLREEESEIIKWFIYYDRQVQEYNRCKRLGISFSNKENLTIENLDILAENKKIRLNYIRNEISSIVK